MLRRAEDRWFTRFRQSGDPQALAAVFDRTAPELLRVALHLLAERATAEDLVHDTFLRAIERKGEFDAERRVLPWLIGILANLARDHRRRLRRAIDPQMALREDCVDPLEEASGAELSAALQQALQRLPETYRQVMVLHLQHGLNAKEIAHALGRPPGTARTQVMRGLEMVRRLLPAGFAAATVVASLPARGLLAVRESVLARAMDGSGLGGAVAAGVAVAGGVLVMQKLIVMAGVVVLVLGGWLWIEAQRGGPSVAQDRPVAPFTAAAASAVSEAGGNAPAPVPTGSARTEVTVPAAGSMASLLVTVRFDDGSPAADIGITVAQSVAQPFALSAIAGEGRTNAEGELRLHEIPAGKVQVVPDRAPLQALRLEPGRENSLAITLPLGLCVEGMVVDEDGKVVDAAAIRCQDDRRGDVDGVTIAHSRRDGTFSVRGLEPRTGTSLWAEAPRRHPSPRQAAGSDRLRLQLGPMGHCLSGQVLDPSRQPVAHAPVLLGIPRPSMAESGFVGYHEEGAQEVWQQVCDGRGRFTFDWLPAGLVRVYAKTPGVTAPQLRGCVEVTIQPGILNEACVQLSLLPAVHGVLRDELGRPIAGNAVNATWRGPELHPDRSCLGSVTVRTAGDGSFRTEGLLPGPWRLWTQRSSELEVEHNVVLVAGQELRWDPVLTSGARHVVRLVDAEGAPLTGWRVRWARWLERSWAPGTFDWVMASDADTGSDGRATATGLIASEYGVQVFPPHRPQSMAGSFPAILRRPVRVPGGELTIAVEREHWPTAQLSGCVLDSGRQPLAGCAISVRPADWPTQLEIVTDAKGRFVASGLLAGVYHLGLRHGAHAYRVLTETVGAAETRELGELQLTAASFLEVRFDSSAGTDPQKLQILLTAGTEPAVGWRGQFDGGVWRSSPLSAGDYRLFVYGPGLAPSLYDVALRAGETLPLDVKLRPGSRCVVEAKFIEGRSGNVNGMLAVRTSAGATVLSERWFGYFNDLPLRLRRCELALLPGDYEIEVQDWTGGRKGVARVEVPQAGLAAPVRIEVSVPR